MKLINFSCLSDYEQLAGNLCRFSPGSVCLSYETEFDRSYLEQLF